MPDRSQRAGAVTAPRRPRRTNGSATVALPSRVAPFVGRQRELADLEGLFETGRLVTLTGTGGSGKTRVALQFAALVRDRRPDGVHFVDLSPVRDPDLVPATIAAALGLRRHPRRSLVDTLVGSIGEQRLLLILDNLEQLPGASPFIGELLARCSNLQVLATSRAPLRLHGEHGYPVGPLILPRDDDLASPEHLARIESIALFVERARAINRDFAITDQNAEAIAAICRRVDGLPLAIELAAARSRMLSPEALLRRLERRLPLLTSGPADAPARQRTLRDTIAWSYELLAPHDQVLFARVAVFVGGFDLPAAEAVVISATDPTRADLLEALGRLVDQNLVRVTFDSEGEPRFSLLDTIREFALERLDPAEADNLRYRHASWFVAFAETTVQQRGFPYVPSLPHRVPESVRDDRAPARWLERMRDDLDNLRAALEWTHERREATLHVRLVVALATFFNDFGDHTEAERWLQVAAALAPSTESGLRAELLFQLANYEIAHGGDRAHIREHLVESLAIREALGDHVGTAYALFMLAAVAADFGDRPASIELQRRGLALARRIDDPLQAERLFIWCLASASELDPAELKTLAEEAIGRGRAVGDRATVGFGSIMLGWGALATDDHGAARAALSEAREVFGDLGGRSQTAWAVSTLGVAYLRSGDLETARVLVRDGCARARDCDVWIALGSLEAAADWLGTTGRHDAATSSWAAIDATRAVTHDRSYGHDLGLFAASRARDRHALRPAAFEAARASGAQMTLEEALNHAIEALDAAGVESGDRRVPAAASRNRRDLTRREQEVLALLADGRSDGEIAEALFISKKTASVHVASIKGKLGAANRVEMAMLGRGIGPIADASAPDHDDRMSR
jgi:predicted ATPase/DNA-binding CsgD family transcriptional regulator